MSRSEQEHKKVIKSKSMRAKRESENLRGRALESKKSESMRESMSAR